MRTYHIIRSPGETFYLLRWGFGNSADAHNGRKSADIVAGKIIRSFSDPKTTSVNQVKYVIENCILYRKFLLDGFEKLLVILACLCRNVLYKCHDERFSGYLGFARTWNPIRTRCYWLRMLSHLRYNKGCENCQMWKISLQKPGGYVEPISFWWTHQKMRCWCFQATTDVKKRWHLCNRLYWLSH